MKAQTWSGRGDWRDSPPGGCGSQDRKLVHPTNRKSPGRGAFESFGSGYSRRLPVSVLPAADSLLAPGALSNFRLWSVMPFFQPQHRGLLNKTN